MSDILGVAIIGTTIFVAWYGLGWLFFRWLEWREEQAARRAGILAPRETMVQYQAAHRAEAS